MNDLAACKQQWGQAMTEFVVSVSYVFLGIFVIVPIFGKLMDLQHQNQLASRYIAWERTVWFDQGEEPDESVQSSAYWESVATRSDDELMHSLSNRFFINNGTGSLQYISEDDINSSSGDGSPLWTYVQSKKAMYGGTSLGVGTNAETGKKESLAAQQTPSIAYDIIGFFQDGLDAIGDPLGDFLGAVGVDNDDFLQFAYEMDNYYSPVIRTQVVTTNSHGGGTGVWDVDSSGNWGSGIEDVVFQNWDGIFEARSAILADGWNTQSLAHYQQRADDWVPSTLFDAFQPIIDVASYLDPAVGTLDFGAVGVEPMPAVDGEPVEHSCEDGFCYFDE